LRLQAEDSLAEAQRTERHVLQQPTAHFARRTTTVMGPSTPKIQIGSVPKTGADAKKAQVHV